MHVFHVLLLTQTQRFVCTAAAITDVIAAAAAAAAAATVAAVTAAVTNDTVPATAAITN